MDLGRMYDKRVIYLWRRGVKNEEVGPGVHSRAVHGRMTAVMKATWVEMKKKWTVEGVKMVFVVYCHGRCRKSVTRALQGRRFGHFSSFVYQRNIEKELEL